MATHDQKLVAWTKAKVVPPHDARFLRQDVCGAWIHWDHYGDRNSDYGWEVDHIRPGILGGGDHADNLQALHWKNNATKQDGPLRCVVTAK